MKGAQTPQEISCFQMGSAQQKWTDRWTGQTDKGKAGGRGEGSLRSGRASTLHVLEAGRCVPGTSLSACSVWVRGGALSTCW